MEVSDGDETFEVPSLEMGEQEYRPYCKLMATRQRRGLSRHDSFWVFATGTALAFVAASSAVFLDAVNDRHAAIVAALSIASFLAGFWLNHAHQWRRYWRAAALTYRDEAARWRESRITIDGAGIRSATPDGAATWHWRAVREVQSRDGLILLWVGRRSPIAISDRAVGSAERRERMLAFVRGKIAAAAA